MKKETIKKDIIKFLASQKITVPFLVDRILVTAFIIKNDIKLNRNQLVREHIISAEDESFVFVLQILAIIEQYQIDFSLETLIKFFELVISPQDKVVNGAIYTPLRVREYIVSQSFKNVTLENIQVADISCGCGAFLLTAADIIRSKLGVSFETVFQKNIFGLDIQEYSVNRTKLLLSLLAISKGEDIAKFSFNIFVGDALDFDFRKSVKKFSGYDVIVGNPPYVCSKNILESTRKLLPKWEVCRIGRPDLYIPFIQIGLENLKDGGTLSLITMNTFFKSLNGRALRSYLQEKSYRIKILDFGSAQVFNSKSTYTCILQIQKEKTDHIKYKLDESVDLPINSFNTIKYASLNAIKGWNLNNIDIINKIESTGNSFGKLYATRNGIATLKNEIFIFDPVDEDDLYYYLQNGKLYEIEKEICHDIVNSNKFTTATRVEQLRQKIIFPYSFNGVKPELLNEQKLRTVYPKAYKYLSAKKDILATRDKGQGDYEGWYAFGRNQSIEKTRYKLFFPHISSDIPNYVINSDENLFFYNGIAAIAENRDDLVFLSKLMRSNLFWFYIKNSSKPYSSGYYSLSRNYIKNFGILDFSMDEKRYIINEDDMKRLNDFIEFRYDIKLS